MENKFLNHLRTVCTHRHKVFIHCCKAGIPLRGLLHDLSKFSLQEFIPSVKHWQGTRSPNEGEREDYGYSIAWMHHKGRNKHHFEYWTDIDPDTSHHPRNYLPVKMPLIYVVEMFCDRVAASKVYKGRDFKNEYPEQYFIRGNAASKMNADTAKLLGNLLHMYAEKGEKETFRYIRKQLLKNKTY